ncbi:MarR family winged helix-turn-helix transcriptional regulator [Salsipaludibacter albus]|uniref:MarR family winged helix-turn-helix transcriptional regulator n=1 Tax=Salsipaludibacter albus TaxID=2849650 RepID=UPI001EE45D6A|nr:MarR family transcriptional regulator [Salsipaludibacter albus]MBY5163549.1 MarR family transcriptional regulator [Salsipaludibacter albus]
MTLSPSHLQAFRSLLEAHARLLVALDDRFRDREISLTFYDVLVHLSEAPDRRLRMQELAQRVLLSKSGLTRLVDRMEQGNLVRREASDRDARGINAVLTDHGLATLEAAVPAHRQDLVDLVSSVIDEREADELAELLGRIRDRALED